MLFRPKFISNKSSVKQKYTFYSQYSPPLSLNCV